MRTRKQKDMDLKEFKKELETVQCALKEDYFNEERKDTGVLLELSNGCTIDLMVGSNWVEDEEVGIDYDSPTIDHSRNKLEMCEISIFDIDGSNLEVTPDIEELLIDWVGNYFQCEVC